MSQKITHYIVWLVLSIPAFIMLKTFIADVSTAHDLLHPSGEFSARLMIVAMLATPLRMLFSRHRWPLWLVRQRRYFGVAAFGYALIHTVFYWVDSGSFDVVISEFWELGIWTGWIAFFIFVPLAVTSNDISQRLMGRRWKVLQRAVYAAAVLTLVHWIFVHNNFGPALVHFIPLAALESYRIIAQQRKRIAPKRIET